MKNLFRECTECDGYGYVTIDLNDTHIPYEQNEIDYTCMYCDGKGLVLDEDELPFRIEDLNDMIEGMQTRTILLPISTSLNNHFLYLILGTFQIKSKTALSKKNKAIMKGNKSIVKYFTGLI